MWEGKYSFVSALEDVHAAVAHLRQNGGRHVVPDSGARRYEIDLDKMAVMGKSGGGGMMGWIATSENPAISTCVAISPTRLLPYPMPPDWAKKFVDLKAATAGRIDIDRELGEMSKEDYDRFDMFKAAPRLVDKNVLLVGDNRADYLKATHWPLVASMEQRGRQALFAGCLRRRQYLPERADRAGPAGRVLAEIRVRILEPDDLWTGLAYGP